MRIIGGTARGRLLKTPVGQEIRPTSDKVRLAIFNALYSRGGVVDKVVLDAFCGTGALGCEAISQGAVKSIFCDISRQSLTLAKENAAALGFEDRAEFILKDAAKLGSRPDKTLPADIIFLDPPYRKNLVTPTLEVLESGNWLADNSLIVIETEIGAKLEKNYGEIVFNKTYGETQVSIILWTST
jgi:16S rRNA (guanine966-N2)-methyltransferase